MDRAHGRTIRSTGRAYHIRTADFRSSTEAVFAPTSRLETTVPKGDFATTPRLPRADFGAAPLPILGTVDSAVMPLPVLAMEDFGATLPRPILVMADFETPPRLLRPPLDYGWAIGRLRRALPAAPTAALSVEWTAAQPPEFIAIMDFPASAPPGALLPPAAVAVAVQDPMVAVAAVAVASADRRQLWQD